MARATVDRTQVKRLYDEGLTHGEIAEKVGCGRSTVTKILRYEMNVPVAVKLGENILKENERHQREAEARPVRYLEKARREEEQLQALIDRVTPLLDWLEGIPLEETGESREWLNSRMAVVKELRQLVSTLKDVKFRSLQEDVLVEILTIVDEEIGNAAPEVQKAIHDRLMRRRRVHDLVVGPGIAP